MEKAYFSGFLSLFFSLSSPIEKEASSSPTLFRFDRVITGKKGSRKLELSRLRDFAKKEQNEENVRILRIIFSTGILRYTKRNEGILSFG